MSPRSTRPRCVRFAQCAHNLALAAAVQFGGTPEQKKLTQTLLVDLCTEDKEVDKEALSRLMEKLESTVSEEDSADSEDGTRGVIVSAVATAIAFSMLRESTQPTCLVVPSTLLWVRSPPRPCNAGRPRGLVGIHANLLRTRSCVRVPAKRVFSHSFLEI